MKKALIVGHNGQDGTLLFKHLRKLNYSVVGIDKGSVTTHECNWDQNVDITRPEHVDALLSSFSPHEIYFLAGYHHSSQDSRDNLRLEINNSYEINVFALLNFLESIKNISPNSRLFYAASSLIFGPTDSEIVDENHAFRPDSIYGITKNNGLSLCRLYRQDYGLHTSVGILFNHESSLRSENFLSKKIVSSAYRISQGSDEKLTLGNLEASTDWGYAVDFVDAFSRILSLDEPDDFIVATGEKHTVIDFVNCAFTQFDLNWQNHVVEDSSILTRNQKTPCGSAKKLIAMTAWEPSVNFFEMIKILCNNERGLN